MTIGVEDEGWGPVLGIEDSLSAPGDATWGLGFTGSCIETGDKVALDGLIGPTPDAWLLGLVVVNPLLVHMVVVPVVVVELQDVTVVLHIVHATLFGWNASTTTYLTLSI